MYVEQDCTITHNGKTYESGGAVITPDYAIGYFGSERTGELVRDRRYFVTDWHGKELGSARITARWRMPYNCMVTSHYLQVEATINGVKYTGRTAGESMIWKGKRCAQQ